MHDPTQPEVDQEPDTARYGWTMLLLFFLSVVYAVVILIPWTEWFPFLA